MYDPPVKKTVFGIPNYNATFTFKLQAQDSSYPMPPGSTNGTKTIRITGSGSGSFGVWSYERTGTYYYTVYEVNDMINGYTYDTAAYIITDMVKEENGALVLTRIVTNSINKPVMSLIFNNYYTDVYPPPIVYPPITTVPPATPPQIQPTTKASTTTTSPSTTTPPAITTPPATGGGTTQNAIPTQNVTSPGNTNEPPQKATAVPPETQPTIEKQTSTTESIPVIPVNVGNTGNPGNPGNNYINSNPIPYGPKTGDDINPAFYTVLLILGGITATGALIYLIIYSMKIKRSQKRI
jgi:pilin isopeptide linkage protein